MFYQTGDIDKSHGKTIFVGNFDSPKLSLLRQVEEDWIRLSDNPNHTFEPFFGRKGCISGHLCAKHAKRSKLIEFGLPVWPQLITE
jgi:hypothetical protein